MSKRPRQLLLGLPIVLAIAVLAVTRLQPQVEAGGRSTAPPASACSEDAPGELARATQPDGTRGTWWRITDRLDGNGVLVGRTLFAGRDHTTTLSLDLGPESMASGPIGGSVVVATDDGRFSDLRLASVIAGCSRLLHRGEDVVRSAILDPTDGSVLAHLITRETRDDLGTWRITGADPDATLHRVAAPLPPQPGLGRIWVTELRLDADANHLAVQSCSDSGCVTRLIPLRGAEGVPAMLQGPDQGSIIGFAGRRLITWSLCTGAPCALQAWDTRTGERSVLIEQAVGAALTRDGRYLVAVTDTSAGRTYRIDLASDALTRIAGVPADELPITMAAGAYAGLEVDAGEIALAAPGADAHAFDLGAAVALP
jgi:hypothetical protein